MSNKALKFGVIGSGSWATALVKILTDNGQPVNWWIRNGEMISFIQKRRHNPHYLPSAYFDTALLHISQDPGSVIKGSDIIIMAVPSAYIQNVLNQLAPDILSGKKIRTGCPKHRRSRKESNAEKIMG